MTRLTLLATAALIAITSGAANAQTQYTLPCYSGVDFDVTVFIDNAGKPDVEVTPSFKSATCRDKATGQPTQYRLVGDPVNRTFSSREKIRDALTRVKESIDDGTFAGIGDDKLPPVVAFVKKFMDAAKKPKAGS